MKEYYAVIRSTDHLAHYGVKGMRWGVRKAIASGNDKALHRHYQKAAKKLSKLQDIGINPGKYAGKSAAYGVAALGTGTIAVKIPKLKYKKTPENAVVDNSTGFKDWVNKLLGYKTVEPPVIDEHLTNRNKWFKIGAGVASAGLAAKSAQNAYRAANAPKYREKAVRWQNEMKSAFAGTPYEGHYEVIPRRRRKKK